MEGTTPSNHEIGQAEPSRLRRVGRWEDRLRRTLAFGADGLLPAVGDRQIAGRSAVNLRYRLSVSVGSALRYLRYLRDLRAKWMDG
jgi:hypothetical protein